MGAPSFFRRRVIEPVRSLLRQGVSPRALALSLAAGAVIAVIPIFGIATFVAFLVAAMFRLNHVAIQLTNYLIYPLQFVLFIPFVRAGEMLLGLTPVVISASELAHRIMTDFSATIAEYGLAIAAATLAWALIAIPLTALLTALLQYVLARWLPSDRDSSSNE
jgi:uncharacterized protein (DUF2062 family)